MYTFITTIKLNRLYSQICRIVISWRWLTSSRYIYDDALAIPPTLRKMRAPIRARTRRGVRKRNFFARCSKMLRDAVAHKAKKNDEFQTVSNVRCDCTNLRLRQHVRMLSASRVKYLQLEL